MTKAVGTAVVVALVILVATLLNKPEWVRPSLKRFVATIGRGVIRIRDFVLALAAVVLTLIFWLVIYRLAYWVAHGVPSVSNVRELIARLFGLGEITYVPLDYVLLFGSLAVALWPVFRLMSPPADPDVE